MKFGYLLVALLACAAGCISRSPEQASESRARYEFKRIVREYQVPASESTNEVERTALLDQALQAFESLRTDYPDAQPWTAMALRQVGVIHASRGERKEALAAYAQVGILYPNEEWEVIQAWKAAGDLLWDSGMKKEALPFYRDIADRFQKSGQLPMYDTIARIARERIAAAANIRP